MNTADAVQATPCDNFSGHFRDSNWGPKVVDAVFTQSGCAGSFLGPPGSFLGPTGACDFTVKGNVIKCQGKEGTISGDVISWANNGNKWHKAPSPQGWTEVLAVVFALISTILAWVAYEKKKKSDALVAYEKKKKSDALVVIAVLLTTVFFVGTAAFLLYNRRHTVGGRWLVAYLVLSGATVSFSVSGSVSGGSVSGGSVSGGSVSGGSGSGGSGSGGSGSDGAAPSRHVTQCSHSPTSSSPLQNVTFLATMPGSAAGYETEFKGVSTLGELEACTKATLFHDSACKSPLPALPQVGETVYAYTTKTPQQVAKCWDTLSVQRIASPTGSPAAVPAS